MASGIADFGASSWLSTLFGIEDPIAGYYLALCLDEPGPGFDGLILDDIEPAGGGYARQFYASDDTHWAVNGNYVTNLLEVGFGTPTLDWGRLTHFALCTAASSGDIYAWGEFLSPSFAAAGFELVLPPGGLVLSLASQDDSITV
jgi:hypothetical protein